MTCSPDDDELRGGPRHRIHPRLLFSVFTWVIGRVTCSLDLTIYNTLSTKHTLACDQMITHCRHKADHQFTSLTMTSCAVARDMAHTPAAASSSASGLLPGGGVPDCSTTTTFHSSPATWPKPVATTSSGPALRARSLRASRSRSHPPPHGDGDAGPPHALQEAAGGARLPACRVRLCLIQGGPTPEDGHVAVAAFTCN